MIYRWITALFLVLSTGCITQSQKDMIEEGWAQLPAIPTPVPARVYDHGRRIEWFTPQGKRVVVHEDGTFESGHWENEARKSWEGICCLYKTKYPEATIEEVEIEGTETKVHNYITGFDPHGKYLDDGSPAKVPNEIQHYIRTRNKETGAESTYYIEFAYGNERDAIYSLNGLYVISGPEGHLNAPAQKRSASDCGGHRTYLR